MKKIYYAIMLLCVNMYVVYAQTDDVYKRYVDIRQQGLKNEDNRSFWTVALSGGGTLYVGESDAEVNVKELITPYGKLAVARWFNSVWGMRLQFDGGMQKNVAIQMWEPGSNGEFYFADGCLELVTNIMNWGAIKRSNRPVSVYLYGGAGIAWTPSRGPIHARISPAAILGGQLNVRLTDFWSINLEVDGMVVNDKFNSHSGGFKFEGYAGAAVGLTYRFSQYKVR